MPKTEKKCGHIVTIETVRKGKKESVYSEGMDILYGKKGKRE